MHLKKLTPNLMVADVNRAMDFYRDTLGFTVLATVPEEGHFDWAMIQSGDVTLMLQARSSLIQEIPALESHPGGGALTLYSDVTGVAELYAKLKGNVTIVQDLHTTFYGAQEFAVQDPDGFILSFAEQTEQTG